MKTLFKPVFAALVALFLTLSLPGCFDEGSKTASQGDGVSSLVFQSQKEGIASDGTTKFYFPVGTDYLAIVFKSEHERDANKDRVREMLAASNIKGSIQLTFDEGISVQMTKPLMEKTLVSLPTEVQSVKPFGLNGLPIFEWNYVQGFVFDSRA